MLIRIEEVFRVKLDTLKESYFPKTTGEQSFVIDNDGSEAAQDIDTTDSIRLTCRQSVVKSANIINSRN